MANYNLVQLVFDRSGLTPAEDTAVMTCHIREVVQGAPDILPVTDQGRQDFISRLTTWFNGGLHTVVSSQITFLEARFYDVPNAFGTPMGDPVLVHTFNSPGTSASKMLPPQIAVSVTFKTDKRKTWGRFYIPGMTDAYLLANGRLDEGICPQIATWTHSLTSRAGTGAALVVFSRKEWTHHDPQFIQVDDLYDVIRSRRYDTPLVRANVSAG